MCTLLYESVLYLDKNKRRINYVAFTNLSLSFNDGFYIEIFAYINSRHTFTQHMLLLCVRQSKKKIRYLDISQQLAV